MEDGPRRALGTAGQQSGEGEQTDPPARHLAVLPSRAAESESDPAGRRGYDSAPRRTGGRRGSAEPAPAVPSRSRPARFSGDDEQAEPSASGRRASRFVAEQQPQDQPRAASPTTPATPTRATAAEVSPPPDAGPDLPDRVDSTTPGPEPRESESRGRRRAQLSQPDDDPQDSAARAHRARRWTEADLTGSDLSGVSPESAQTESESAQTESESAQTESESVQLAYDARSVVEPVSPVVEPVSPAVEPVDPVTEPADPEVEPASPMVEPSSPVDEADQPAAPQVEPASSSARRGYQPDEELPEPSGRARVRRRGLVLLSGMLVLVAIVGGWWTLRPTTPAADPPRPATVATPAATSSTPSTPAPTSAKPSVTAKATRPVKGNYLGALALVDDSAAKGMPTLRPDLAAALVASKPVKPTPSQALADQPSVYRTGCQRSVQTTEPSPAGQCIIGDPKGTVSVAVVGDSKADQWEAALQLVGERHGWRIELLAKSGCAYSSTPQYTECDRYNTTLAKRLQASPPQIVITSTQTQVSGAGAGMADLLGKLKAKGATVVALADTPDPQRMESLAQCAERSSLAECGFTRNDGAGTAELQAMTSALSGVTWLNLNPWVCPPAAEKCTASVGNVFVYRQSSHLTDSYVASLAPILERFLKQAGLITGPVLALQPR